ncbi:MAG: O-antigen ligase family protein [Candidatus Krumholzibacteriia bacterium]
MTAASLDRLADALHRAMLLSLPWIGVGTVHLLLGVDIGAGVQPAYVLLGVGLALRAAAQWRRGRAAGALRPPRGAVAAAGLLMAAVLLSAFGVALERSLLATPGQAWWRYAKQTVQLAVMLAFFLEIAAWTRGEQRWRSTARWLAAGIALQVAYGAWQAWSFHHPHELFRIAERAVTSNPAILAGSTELHLGDRMVGLPRLRGMAAEPLYLGNYLLVALPVALVGLRGRDRAALAVSGLLLLAATWSRGAYLGLGAAVVTGAVLWLRVRPRGGGAGVGAGRARRSSAAVRWFGVGLGLVVVAVAMVVVVAGPEALSWPWARLQQTFSPRDWSNLTRYFSMQAAWRGFLLSPLVGVGWGQYGYHFALLVDPLGLQSQFTWPVAGSIPLLVLCETGLAGLGAVVVVAVQTLRTLLRRARPRAGAVWLVAAAAAAAGCSFQLLTFSQYNLPHVWVAWGLLAAALREEIAPEVAA